MKNRLEVARDLLHKNGSIWINIDDDEGHYLKVLCDEMFGRDNFVANVIWEKKYSPQNDARWLSDSHDHILVYAKNKQVWRPVLLPRTEEMNIRYKNLDNDPRGLWKSSGLDVKTYSEAYDYPIKTPSGRIVNPPKGYCWRVSKERFEQLVKDNRIWFGKDGNNVPSIKRFLLDVQEGTVTKTIWFREEVGDNQEAKQETKEILGDEIFNTPKPERLLQRIIHLGSVPGDIVLDFYAGSGTTAAVALKMGRRFITCEQMDYIEGITVQRLRKVIGGEQGGISKSVNWQGGGEFIYYELMKYNEAYIHRIHKAKTAADLLAIWKNMQEKAFISYRVEPKAINENTSDFEKLTIDEKKRLLIEILDKNQLYVNYSEMDDAEYRISETDKKLNRKFYEEG
jgi:adenine-specific DNA-methyltransferase